MNDCELNISFSFEYSVNKKYSIEYITKKKKEKCNDIIFDLFKKLEELSKMKFVDFQNRPKNSGYEMIPISELNFKINENCMKSLCLSEDSKIIVFRFHNQNCRLLLAQSRKCSSLFYVIGYDWDFSAYDHG